MSHDSNQSTDLSTPIPADDLNHILAIARPDTDGELPHIGIVGDTYTILLSGRDNRIPIAVCLRRKRSKFPASYTKSRQSPGVMWIFDVLDAQP